MVKIENLSTEKRNTKTMDIDKKSALEIMKLINNEDKTVAESISTKLEAITKTVELANDSLSHGGRMIYIGAGTSGRLGVLDAVECPPTYGVSFETVQGLMAGGKEAFIKAKEGVEDSKDEAVRDLKGIALTDKDIVIGIAASGRTPYVIGGLEYAKEVGAKTSAISMSVNSEVGKYTDNAIEVVVGSEVVTGSTRMKAGTAQKMILNMISTGVMILQGKVYENLMVGVQPTNKKLIERGKNIVIEATGVTYEQATKILEETEYDVKLAIMMLINNLSKEKAQEKLVIQNGHIRK